MHFGKSSKSNSYNEERRCWSVMKRKKSRFRSRVQGQCGNALPNVIVNASLGLVSKGLSALGHRNRNHQPHYLTSRFAAVFWLLLTGRGRLRLPTLGSVEAYPTRAVESHDSGISSVKINLKNCSPSSLNTESFNITYPCRLIGPRLRLRIERHLISRRASRQITCGY